MGERMKKYIFIENKFVKIERNVPFAGCISPRYYFGLIFKASTPRVGRHELNVVCFYVV